MRRKRGEDGLKYPAFEEPLPGPFVPFANVREVRHLNRIGHTNIIYFEARWDIFIVLVLIVRDFFHHEEHKGYREEHKGGTQMLDETVFKKVLDLSFKIHKQLGPGLLESAYEACLFYELSKSGLCVEKQKPLPLVYEDVRLEAGYRVDLLVEKQVIIEVKSVEALADIHMAQILTYLKLSGCRLGLLANFNVAYLRDGIRRVILTPS